MAFNFSFPNDSLKYVVVKVIILEFDNYKITNCCYVGKGYIGHLVQLPLIEKCILFYF